MKTKEEILKEHYFRYYKDAFPTDEQAHKWSEIGLLIKEETQAVYDAMDEYADQKYNEAIRDAAENARTKTCYESCTQTHYEDVDKQSILKLLKK